MPRFIRTPFALVAAVVLLAAGLAAIHRPADASAHPLGNFTINHYTRIDVSEAGIELYRVLDMAEIPALQERQRIDTDDDGQVDAAESDAYASSKATTLAEGMALRVNGEGVTLTPIGHDLTFPEGQGGLSLLRLTVTYRATLPDDWRDSSPRVEFGDDNYTDRLGWREVVVRGGPGVELLESSAPALDISGELTMYPEDSLSSPLDVRVASFGVRPAIGAPLTVAHPHEGDAVRGNQDATLSRFSDLIAKDHLSAGVIAIALLVAVGFGAVHALSPGHGKTVVAAYLVGSRGTARHALLLGLVVTATHTSTVYLLGFVTLYLSQYIVPEELYPWLGITSGVLILAMGVSLFAGRLLSSGLLGAIATSLRARFSASATSPHLTLAHETASSARYASFDPAPRILAYPGDHAHHDRPHEHHDHEAMESHRHGFGTAHSHRLPGQDGEPVKLRSLIGLGVFGGMIPCPSAIVVMLSAIALHRVVFGLVLIVAFSLGLAGVLCTIGFALVFTRSIGERLPLLRSLSARIDRGGAMAVAVRTFPIASAAAVVAAGLVITLRALVQQGTL